MGENAARPWFSFYGDIPWTVPVPEVTLYGAFAEAARRNPMLHALEYMGAKLTFAELLALIDTAAAALARGGVGKDDCVTLALPNVPGAVILFYAANKLGARVAMVHPLSPPNDLEHYLRETGSRWAVTMDMFAPKFEEILKNTQVETLLIVRVSDYLPRYKAVLYNLAHPVALPDDARVLRWDDFMESVPYAAQDALSRISVENAQAGAAFPEEDEEHAAGGPASEARAPAVILFSGGTTDMPKGILLSAYAFNALAVSMRATIGFMPGDSVMAILPIFHGFGLGLCVHTALVSGGMSILIPQFSPDNFIKSLMKQKPQYIAGVPTLFEALLRRPDFKRVRFDKLKGAYSGGDTLGFEIKQKFDAALRAQGSRVDLLEGYGTTECVTACVLTPVSHYRKDSIGVPMPGVETCIVREDGNSPLPPGEEGEICVAGPQLMLGYLGAPEETRRTLRVHEDGKLWLHTGDAGMMDEDGFLYFRSRIKRIIKVSGMSVYPAQVERVLEAHPAVWRACVVGVPDDYQMMSVKAFVVLHDRSGGSEELVQQLLAHCAASLIKWSVPRSLEFKAELPTTLVGKVAYNLLKKKGGDDAVYSE